MTAHRYAAGAAVVVVLVAATALYVHLPGGGWLFLISDERDIAKFGGRALWDAEIARWWTATIIGLAATLLCLRLPLVALAVTSAMTLVHSTSKIVPFLPVDFAAAVALYLVASRPGPRWVSYTALGVTTALSWAPVLQPGAGLPALGLWGGGALVPPIMTVVAWLVGDRARIRRAHLEDVERDRDRQAELATLAERARISRELHDVIAHGLSIIVIQAQAATGALRKRPETVAATLATIIATGRDALTEMRHLFGLTPADGASLTPLPGLADLPALIDRVRAAGLPVTLTVDGTPVDPPAGVTLSAYRIIQESLTNVLKHAGAAARATVVVRYEGAHVDITVTDTGVGDAGPRDGPGQGIAGMRERVAMLGGAFTAGAHTDGGFRVQARLPLPEPA